jgi:hypothetical protein
VTPVEIRRCLLVLHWSQRSLAAILAYDPRQVRRWLAGDSPMPVAASDWLRRRAQAALDDPPPQRR